MTHTKLRSDGFLTLRRNMIPGGARASATFFNNSFGKSSMRASPVLIMLLCLASGGCAGLSANDTPQQLRAVMPPPDGKKLAELVSAAFKTAKLPGAPEVSPVYAAHGAQWGDWIFCIKSSDSDQLPKYAVLIGDNTILEVRSFVLIDGCDKEAYHPVEIASEHGNSDERHVDIPPQSRPRHQMKAL